MGRLEEMRQFLIQPFPLNPRDVMWELIPQKIYVYIYGNSQEEGAGVVYF